MEQKLFITSVYGKNQEVETPDDLQRLFSEGWQIKQISAFGYAGGNAYYQRCIILLERSK